jgi:hypothetical protein
MLVLLSSRSHFSSYLSLRFGYRAPTERQAIRAFVTGENSGF